MAKLEQMLEIAGGSFKEAEKIAREKGKESLLDLQLLQVIQGKFRESRITNEKALKVNPNDLRAKYNKGWFLMRDGDLFEGFKLMNEGRWIECWGNKHIGTDKPIWDGSQLSGEHILFYCEAGIGDQIIFIRFVKEIIKRGGKPIVCCNKELTKLFSKIPECSAIINKPDDVYHDYWVPSMAIPVILKTTYNNLNGEPYLKSIQKNVDKFRGLMRTKKFKVGIRLYGNQEFENEQFRIFPKELMFDAINGFDFKVFSLQDNYDDGELPDDVINMSPFLRSWEDTAGIVENLDLVITSCTGLAHLSAAMGKPTWIVVPVLPYWSWALPGSTSSWYKSVKLFRQKKFRNWEEPFNNIKQELGVF